MSVSVILPSIRLENWDRFYNSIAKSCTKYDFEIIFVGPEPNINCEAWKDTRVKFVRSFASPNTAQHLGLLTARNEVVFFAADDCVYEEGAIDKCLDKMYENGDSKTVVVTKYTEGDYTVHNNQYYQLNKAYPYSPHIPDNWVIFNCAFLFRKYLLDLGGYDTQFKIPCIGFADLAVRCQRDGCNIIFVEDAICHCDHGQADHMPIERGQILEDAPLYHRIHNTYPDRIKIRLNNWEHQPQVWSRYK